MSALSLPPLFEALATAGEDPFAVACAEAVSGCDAGLMTYDLRPDVLRAAIVFAPEVILRDAAIMLPICGVGFQNAFGALAPPEVAVHLEWNGIIRINGGKCGHLQMATSHSDPNIEPDWLVIGLELKLWPASEDTGHTPDETALYNEGCADIEAPHLLEAWVRHTLVWINRWTDEGTRPVHNEWKPLVHGIDTSVTQNGQSCTFMGVDEHFGMILKTEADTKILPLTDILTEVP